MSQPSRNHFIVGLFGPNLDVGAEPHPLFAIDWAEGPVLTLVCALITLASTLAGNKVRCRLLW